MSSIRDCFGIEYTLKRMPANGLCGFHSLAYALTGSRYRHADIIEDLLAVFFANPQLFVLQTEYGKKFPNLSKYASEMRKAAAKQTCSPSYWLEDGHIIAFCMLYDVAVFVYDFRCKKWHAYGNAATKGYICLLATGGHFDVLEGKWPCKPTVPRQAEKQGLNTEVMTWNPVQINVEHYRYTFVSKWNNEGVEIVDSNGSTSPLRASYADMVRRGNPVTATATLNSLLRTHCHQDPPVLMTALSIECNVCGQKCLSKRALRYHLRNMHDDTTRDNAANQESGDAGDTDSVGRENSDVSDANVCDVEEHEMVCVESGGAEESVAAESDASVESEMELVTSSECGESVTEEIDYQTGSVQLGELGGSVENSGAGAEYEAEPMEGEEYGDGMTMVNRVDGESEKDPIESASVRSVTEDGRVDIGCLLYTSPSPRD